MTVQTTAKTTCLTCTNCCIGLLQDVSSASLFSELKLYFSLGFQHALCDLVFVFICNSLCLHNLVMQDEKQLLRRIHKSPNVVNGLRAVLAVVILFPMPRRLMTVFVFLCTSWFYSISSLM